MQSLRDLLCTGGSADRPDDQLVAFGGAGDRCWGDFRAHVTALRDTVAAARVRRWLVFSEDAYAFAVAVLAVAHARGVAVLPPNGQAGTIARLAESVDGLIVDAPGVLAVGGDRPVLPPLSPGPAMAAPLDALDPDAPFVELVTSGSTGAAKTVGKRLCHLDDEVQVLERLFGERVAGARFHSTVSHQHIYGILFRVLWPLAAGRPFCARTYLHASEIAARLVGGASVLVSTPVQLKLMAGAAALEGIHLRAVFSSGAPLDGKTAARLARMAGTAPCEVFGSTETGGVAWRQRPRGGDEPWQPMPGVEISADPSGALAVRSPFVSVGDGRRFVMGDRAELSADGRFRLRGRSDRIVKVGAKRLSLPEMEEEIGRHPYVEETALVSSRRGVEERVCAAVVLSAAGRTALQEKGRAEVGRELATALAPFFDRVLLPRAWRFVDALPRDAQGKVPANDLRALFAAGEEGRVLDPRVESECSGAGFVERACVVPGDLAFLEGHFDGAPLVAGVVQMRWVVGAVQEILGAEPAVRAVEALKFRRPLLPGDRFSMRVEVDGERARFRLSRDGEEISSGRLTLG